MEIGDGDAVRRSFMIGSPRATGRWCSIFLDRAFLLRGVNDGGGNGSGDSGQMSSLVKA